jgi:hypothetical protein
MMDDTDDEIVLPMNSTPMGSADKNPLATVEKWSTSLM